MQTAISDKTLTIYLQGEIDHHTAAAIRNQTDSRILRHAPEELILDFSGVSFMDSSGVGLVIGRYKLALSRNCRTVVTGLRERDKRILMLSGLQNKIEFR